MDAMTNKWLSKQYYGLIGYIEEIKNKNFIFDTIAIEFGRFSNLNGLILDVGCGIRSDLAYALYSKGSDFVGIDPFIEHKRNFEFVGGVGEHLPFHDNSFDHVIFATSLDHIVNPNVVLREAKRVLKDGGKINIWSSCFDWFERFREGEMVKAGILFFWNLDFKIRKKDSFHFSHFTTSEIMSLLRATGFIPMKIEKMLLDTSTSVSVFFQAEKKEL